MNTKEHIFTEDVVIDDATMEMLAEISERKGRSMEQEIQKYVHYVTVGRKKIAAMGMSPSLSALVGMCGKVPDDYDWRKDVEDELFKEYIN